MAGGPANLSRRTLLSATAAIGLGACTDAPVPYPTQTPPLKSLVPFRVGTACMTGQFNDETWAKLVQTHFNQLTPEWEMKMEYILQEDGSYRFDAPDLIAKTARDHGLALFGHALIWYAQDHPWFKNLVNDRRRFAADYDRYIQTVAGRWADQIVGWDVVNEPVTYEGDALRQCVWSEGLGGTDAYIIRAFEQARMAAPSAVLFLNDYDLENKPNKGATYLKLVERMLKQGVPITGLGTQSHLEIDIPAGQIRAFMNELAQFGLPIHVAELDASLRSRQMLKKLEPRSKRVALQSERVAELAEAFMALPRAQQFAFTLWGVRDTDSWLRRGNEDDGKDSPLLFDTDGYTNPLFGTLATALNR